MRINKQKYKIHINKFNEFLHILDDFILNKNYQKKNFLKNLMIDINTTLNTNFDKIRIYHILLSYNKYNYYFNKLNDLKCKIDSQLCTQFNQSGGFFYNKYDNKYMKTLSIIDFLFDIINLIPNQMITSTTDFVTMPYAISSLLLNLFRGDYDFAFYSFLSIIPGVGGILGTSGKIIHKIIRYIINSKKVENVEGYYKQILAARRVHDFVKDENYEKLNNPYIGEFENQYNYEEIDNLYLK